MIPSGFPTIDPEAAIRIGLVFVQAVVLYVGYGALERAIGPQLVDRLTGSDDAARN